ncbi:MAG: 50S ribosomal protein L23 [Alphaproteobacteria bacterium]|nr:50S ribosomal protein L23 [Alphaproteobacteria bacterium]
MAKSKKTNDVTAKMYDTLVRPVITEKSMISSEAGKVTFMVPLDATKGEVKSAVESIFNTKVVKVNTVRQFGKEKVFKGRIGQRSDYKKAIVTLADGQNIDITTGI